MRLSVIASSFGQGRVGQNQVVRDWQWNPRCAHLFTSLVWLFVRLRKMQAVHLLFSSRSELLLLWRKPCPGFRTRPDARWVQHFHVHFGNGLIDISGSATLRYTDLRCALLIKRQKHLEIILSSALRSLAFFNSNCDFCCLALAGQVSHPHDELVAGLVLDGHIPQFLADFSRVLCLWSRLGLWLLYGIYLALSVPFDVVLLLLWRRIETSTLAVLSIDCGGARVLDPEMLRRQFDRFELVHVQRLDQGVALLLGHSDVVRSALYVGILSLLIRLITWSCLHLN